MTKKEVICWAGTILLFLGSLQCVSQSVPDRRQQIELHGQQAQEFLKENRPDLAAAEFRAIVSLDPNNVDARGNLGVLLFFQNNYAEAIPQLRATLSLRPNLWKIQSLLGIAEKRTGATESARADLEEAFPKLKEQNVQIEAGMELIGIYSGSGDLDKAAATISILRGLYPTNAEVLYASYRIYSDLAAESMLSLSIVAPDSARMHQVMAHELERQGDTEGAIKNYREALKLNPQLPGLHFELAEVLNASSVPQEKEAAEGEYKAALAVNPFDEQSERRLGDIATRTGDEKGAYEYYSRAVQLEPNDAEADLGLAKTLISMHQPQKAEVLFEKTIQLDPTIAVAHYRLSLIYRDQRRTADAQREMKEFLKYKQTKDKLRNLYLEMRLKPAQEESDETDAKK